MKAWNSTLKPSSMKRRIPKRRAGHNKAYLEACRDELCYLRIPSVCIGGISTVVPAHSNQSKHGKGMGLKANDEFTVPACHSCHQQIDQGNIFSRDEKFTIWDQAYAIWEPVRTLKMAQKNSPVTAITVPDHIRTTF